VSVCDSYELAVGVVVAMDVGGLRLYLQNIEEYVMDEDKIVS
jgi:hypothetical protein